MKTPDDPDETVAKCVFIVTLEGYIQAVFSNIEAANQYAEWLRVPDVKVQSWLRVPDVKVLSFFVLDRMRPE